MRNRYLEYLLLEYSNLPPVVNLEVSSPKMLHKFIENLITAQPRAQAGYPAEVIAKTGCQICANRLPD